MDQQTQTTQAQHQHQHQLHHQHQQHQHQQQQQPQQQHQQQQQQQHLSSPQQQSLSSGGAVRTARKQWSSCDFCRERKKKCDAREQKALGRDKCSRCQENDCKCTFSYVSQKNTIRNAKRNEAQARRLSTVANEAQRPYPVHAVHGNNLAQQQQQQLHHHHQQQQQHQQIHGMPMHPQDAFGMDPNSMDTTGFNGFSHVEMLQDFGQLDDFDPMIAIDDPRLDQAPSLQGTGHVMQQHQGQQQQQPTWSIPSTTTTPNGSIGLQQQIDSDRSVMNGHAPPSVVDSQADGSEFLETISAHPMHHESPGRGTQKSRGSAVQQSDWLVRPSSGLSPEMELHLLREYMDLTHPQMPIIDKDLVFLRYRCCMPSPLPRYLLLTIMACGAGYSAQRPDSMLDPLTARQLYDEAKREILATVPEETTIDAIVALIIIAFHWQDELSGPYRQIIQNMAIAKIQALKLHTNEGIITGRTQREVGVLKWMVWLQYYTEVFGWWDAETDPYLNQDISLDLLTEADNDFLLYDYLSGERRKEISDEDLTLNLHFSRMFSELALLQNDAIRRRRRGRPLHSLIPELQSIRMRIFPTLLAQPDKIRDPTTGLIKPLAAGMLALNVAFWYCWLYVHFDVIKPYLKITDQHASMPVEGGIRSPFNRSHSHDSEKSSVNGLNDVSPNGVKAGPDVDPQIVRRSIAACVEACLRNMDIFDAMVATGRVRLTTQFLRDLLYFAGRHLQILFKNKVPGIGPQELARWERCLEISERVWGMSSRGLDLSSMSLEEIE
ncbi:hypothetical protein PYCC9005_005013 [Savitreella phatthalungensis]